MPFQSDSMFPSGGLDQDRDFSLIKPGDYVDALNVQHLTDGGQSSYAIQNTKGNTFRFGIPAITAVNKIVRVLIQTNGATARQVTFYKTNGSVLATVNYTDNAVFGTAFTNFQTAASAALAAATPAQTVSITNVGLYAYVTITTVLGYEWGAASTGANSTEVTVLREARSLSIAGNQNVIGSYDLLGNLFIWSSSQSNLPYVFASIIATANNGSGLIRVQVASTAGLLTGQSVSVEGAISDTSGLWIVTVIDSTHFDLMNSIWSATSTGTVTTNVEGYGEIGVAVYDPNTDVFTYTRLLQSKEFNFRVPKQVDAYCEANNFQYSLYWTDDYNIPRVLYYTGAFITDGALSYAAPDGKYAYGSIADETKLVIGNENILFSFTNQLVSGGSVLSGNWRYAVRLLTAAFSPTNWTDLSNPINVYLASQAGVISAISGDEALVVTPKINEFTVSNLTIGLFKYIELAGVNYVNGAIVGSIIKRIAIDAVTMTIQHTGNETGVTNLDVATLNQFSFDIETAKNIDAIDNRLILSNLTTSQETDFSAWTATWKHRLFQKSITAVGQGSSVYGEYANPNNVYSYVGYMYNESYRFFAKLKLNNGLVTKSFWIDDITFDRLLPARRNATFATYDMTNAGASLVYVPAVSFEDIDLSYPIDGVAARDLVEYIYIERVECVPEVLCSGIAVLAIEGGVGIGPAVTPDASVDGFGASYSTQVPPVIYAGEQPPFATDAGANIYANVYGAIANTTKDNNYFSLYSPDILYGQASTNFQAGDIVLNYSQPIYTYAVNFANAGDRYANIYFELSGNYSTTTPQQVTVLAATDLAMRGTTTLGGLLYSKRLYRGTNANNDEWQYIQTPVIKTSAVLTSPPTNGNTDIAHYNVQVKRALTNKYGDITSNVTIPTGAYYHITTSSPAIIPAAGGIDTYGGDVFTQKSFVRNRLQAAGTSYARLGFIQGFAFYSQNRINVQMTKRYASASAQWIYPNTTLQNWLESLAVYVAPTYNTGYNIKNEISSTVAFDSSFPDQSDLPTEIRWSDLKSQNSIVDNYRIFLPLNFKDLPMTFGEITHHANFNGELFTWQPRMVQRQYFNTRGTMNVGGGSSGNTEVLIGDGSVMSRDGQLVTRIGTYHKWSVIKGKSAQGNDVMYWINTELKKVMRMGYDGTISIGDIHDMQSFFANYLTWVEGKDNPAAGQGICGVWDDRYIAAIWTARGKMASYPQYSATLNYPEGIIVTYNENNYSSLLPVNTGNTPASVSTFWLQLTATKASNYSAAITYAKAAIVFAGPRFSVYSTYEETGEFYISLANGNIANDPTAAANKWYLVPHHGTFTVTFTDTTTATYDAKDFYNEYTIEFNEQKNRWTTFYTFLPKIFLKWTDTFLTPKPIANTGFVYEHRLGTYCSWYDGGQIVDAYIDMIYNKEMNSKQYLALWFETLIIPVQVDLFTQRHQSFLLAADFENNLDFFTGAIKNDILTSSNGLINSEDTSKIFGSWVRIKMTFSNSVFQKLVSLVLKFFVQSRRNNK